MVTTGWSVKRITRLLLSLTMGGIIGFVTMTSSVAYAASAQGSDATSVNPVTGGNNAAATANTSVIGQNKSLPGWLVLQYYATTGQWYWNYDARGAFNNVAQCPTGDTQVGGFDSSSSGQMNPSAAAIGSKCSAAQITAGDATCCPYNQASGSNNCSMLALATACCVNGHACPAGMVTTIPYTTAGTAPYYPLGNGCRGIATYVKCEHSIQGSSITVPPSSQAEYESYSNTNNTIEASGSGGCPTTAGTSGCTIINSVPTQNRAALGQWFVNCDSANCAGSNTTSAFVYQGGGQDAVQSNPFPSWLSYTPSGYYSPATDVFTNPAPATGSCPTTGTTTHYPVDPGATFCNNLAKTYTHTGY